MRRSPVASCSIRRAAEAWVAWHGRARLAPAVVPSRAELARPLRQGGNPAETTSAASVGERRGGACPGRTMMTTSTCRGGKPGGNGRPRRAHRRDFRAAAAGPAGRPPGHAGALQPGGQAATAAKSSRPRRCIAGQGCSGCGRLSALQCAGDGAGRSCCGNHRLLRSRPSGGVALAPAAVRRSAAHRRLLCHPGWKPSPLAAARMLWLLKCLYARPRPARHPSWA